MEDDGELEKRAVAELLNETNRARVRAETMGPAGWMKCPLRSTNKRFLLNTLRSTTPQQRTSGRSGPNRSRSRGRSRTPAREPQDKHREHRDKDPCRDSPGRRERHQQNKDGNAGHRYEKREHRGDGDSHRNKKYQDKRAPGHKRDMVPKTHTSPSKGQSSSTDHSRLIAARP
ncbi:protein POLR1D [Esox lucius]|uniref:DNA-directed RNA polymerases I and III subunit RPAC2 n=1 Tax=Esox lucius TaxID=8010 RepID=A0AAY5K1M2_ESOLU|nr:protein POLR1D [Esox lucius]